MYDDLTIVILTLNEADRVERCLRSIPDGPRVVVIDSFSNDGTLARVRAVWAAMERPVSRLALVERQWLGFTRARNESLKWVGTPWVLWLDADEWMSPELTNDLRALAEFPADRSVFLIPRQSWFLGRRIRHGGWSPDRKARLGRVGKCAWISGPLGADVHETLAPSTDHKTGLLQSFLGHEPFRDEQDQRDTNDRYSTLLAQGLAQKLTQQGRSPPPRWFIRAKVAIKFAENYLWKLGFLDGKQGLIIARGSAKSLGMRLQKTRDLMLPGGA